MSHKSNRSFPSLYFDWKTFVLRWEVLLQPKDEILKKKKKRTSHVSCWSVCSTCTLGFHSIPSHLLSPIMTISFYFYFLFCLLSHLSKGTNTHSKLTRTFVAFSYNSHSWWLRKTLPQMPTSSFLFPSFFFFNFFKEFLFSGRSRMFLRVTSFEHFPHVNLSFSFTFNLRILQTVFISQCYVMIVWLEFRLGTRIRLKF